MKRIIQASLLIFLVISPLVLQADDAANSDAIRVEIEYLRETGELSIGGIDIAAGNALAEFYERRNFAPTWTNPDQVGDLLKMVRGSHADGLDPADYHVDEIETVYAAIRRG